MEKKVLLEDLVSNGSNVRKQITSKVRVSDQGVYPIGEIWDANTVLDVIINGAHEQHDNIGELDDFVHSIDEKADNEIARAEAAEQGIYNLIGELDPIVDQYAIYTFISYNSDGSVVYGNGKAQLTGIQIDDMKQIVVIENAPDSSFVDQNFFIASNAAVDGETLNQLFDEHGNEVGIAVKILQESETTYKNPTVKEYIDYMVSRCVQGGSLLPNSVTSTEIKNNTIKLEDFSQEVKDKMTVTVDEEDERAHFPG